ncbi:Mur ligase family protein [Rossellomorea aquimaris]|uniref:Mur ligase family protein n=1 Tax=Rossellomorea aquimaris TaxID=189382 RepID=UPI001653B5FF|nr:Mur ligase family protein [Rossellomorea aquimaris]
MKRLQLKEVIEVVGGRLVHGSKDVVVKDAVIYHLHPIIQSNTMIFLDRRQPFNYEKIQHLEPFVIISDARNSREIYQEAFAVIEVENIRKAIFAFAEYYRSLFNIPVIAITGTDGKTTTKDMIVHILKKQYSVQSTVRSRNAPRKSFEYLMGIDEDTEVGVFETGLGAPGNLRYHCDIFQPTIGIITNIGIFHLDKCKTLENYILAKGEIIEGLKNKGTLLVNGDDENIATLPLKDYKGKLVSFGKSAGTDLRATDIKMDSSQTKFTMTYDYKQYSVVLPCLGEHQAYNAMAAIGAVLNVGVDITNAINALQSFNVLEKHLQVKQGIKDSTIIDDSWSLTPGALKEALKVLQSIAYNRKKIVLIGDIGRLGDHTTKTHLEVGEMISEQNIDVLITYGQNSKKIADRVEEKNTHIQVYSYLNIQDVYQKVISLLSPDSLCLFKCSNTDNDLMELKEHIIKKGEMERKQHDER